MSVTNVTSDPYAYMDQNDPATRGLMQYQPPEKSGDPQTQSVDGKKDMALFGEDGFGFDDFLDIINPLQHLPIISNLYREFTGDELSPGARMIGGGIFGGGIGLAASIVNTAIEAETGKDIGGHVIAMLSDEEEPILDNAATSTDRPAPVLGQNEQVVQPLPSQSAAQAAILQQVPNMSAIEKVVSPAATGKPQLYTGLEWKGQGQDQQKNIDILHKLNTKGLSEAQMDHLMNAFGPQSAAPISPSPTPQNSVGPAETPREASDAYRKHQPVIGKTPLNISQSFDYLDQTV